ncbi:MAG: phenylalanine--tRNA ligase subunit beta [Muribaculaceae bacterium]|nr:phenylalanine--tRNA ligase subunit beta [Muribaculaceae bacterium]
MNISYKWLKEYVDIDLTPEALSALLTSIGLEVGTVERVQTIRGGLEGIVIGRVLTCIPHPDSNHLHITTVDLDGKGTPTQIVCGAPNVNAGQNVVVATVGTTLYAPDGSEFKIKKSKIRGVESFGMICAEDEIGIGTSHNGIIVLGPEADSKIGTPAADYYGIEDDYLFEVDLTPNRIDAASHYGVARDVAAALTGRDEAAVKAHKPSVDSFATDGADKAVDVKVEAVDGVTRYCGITVRGVKIGPSPEWLAKHLQTIGLHPINNVVDITNYILHAIGQPLHAFDIATLEGEHVVVRRAEEGAKFTTLDGVEHTLTAADLMICDGKEAKCIAGVFGGLDSGVKDSTTDVFIESACFNATSVRRTARRHGISTDSSFRFERGVDPNGCLYALKLAAILLRDIAGGTISGPVVDYYPTPVEPYHVEMEYSDFSRLIGTEIPRATIDTILGALEIENTGSGDHLDLHVPTYRVDVRRPCDVIEDVLRIYGYNRIDGGDELHASLSYKTAVDASDDLRRTIAEQLTGAGWVEILNNSLTAEAYYSTLADYPADHSIKLFNPLSQDLNVLRQTLVFGGLESAAHNINRRNPDLAFYEFGNVYSLNPAKESTKEAPLAPFTEKSHLAMWLTGDTRSANWLRGAEKTSFYDLRAAIDGILHRAGLTDAEIVWSVDSRTPDTIFGQSMTVATAKGKVLGKAGIVAQPVLKAVDIKQPVYYAELDWTAIAHLAGNRNVLYAPLPKAQAVKRDLSLLLDADTTMAQVEAAVRAADKRILRSVELFDVYEGDKLPAGKKSYAITITLCDDEKTLQDKYIDKVMSKIIDNLKRQLNAELR